MYEWVDPFAAIEEAKWYRHRDYDFRREVEEYCAQIRDQYAYENAQLRTVNEHLTKQIMVLLPPMSIPTFLKPQGDLT